MPTVQAAPLRDTDLDFQDLQYFSSENVNYDV